MTCSQVRRLLAYEPKGAPSPHSPAVRSHLEGCPACRSYWQALVTVDRALAARPLAALPESLASGVMVGVARYPRGTVAPPFSRAFWLFSAALTLGTLVGGAWLLHYGSLASQVGPAAQPPAYLVLPAWPSDASAWLSLEGGRVAQIVLACLSGILVTVASAALGYRASERRPHDGPVAEESIARPQP